MNVLAYYLSLIVRYFRVRFGMSLFANILQWFQQSGLEDDLKKVAIAELSDTADMFVKKVEQHAPDMADLVKDKMTTALATAVAGALTRK